MIIKAVIFDLDDTLYSSTKFYNAVYKCIEHRYNIDKKYVLNFLISRYKDKNIKYVMSEISKCNIKLNLIKNADELLKCLKHKRYKIGMITNGLPVVQKIKIKKLGIYSLFDSIIYAVESALKPSYIPYLKSVRELNVSPHESVYIGDNPDIDFCGACKIGMHTIRVKYGMYKNLPSNRCVEYEINDYKALLRSFGCL